MPSRLVPSIDLASSRDESVVAALMASSCAFVTGHGVADSLRSDLTELSRAFFDLPFQEKARVRWPGDGYWRGWQPLFDAPSGEGDDSQPLERYEFHLAPGSDSSDEGLLRRSAEFGFWPSRPEGFRLVWARYHAALARLASAIVTSIAKVLDLPEDEWPDWCEKQFANLVVNNYLAQVDPPPSGQIRQRPHTDIGGLTILWADDAPGGLEVRMPGVPGWTAVEFPPDAFLIQAGDLLARWTNQMIRPNIHRVVNPPPEVAACSRRMSIVYFHYPKLETVVTPAPSCVSAERPAGVSIDAGAHLLSAVAEPGARYREFEDTTSGT